MNQYELNGKFYSSDEIQQFLNPKLENLKGKNDRISKVIDFFDNDFTSLLDIGSNVGGFLQLMQQYNPTAKKLYGLECYEPCIKICKEFIEDEKIKFFSHDCGIFPFENNSFDVITFFEVLEHVRDLNLFLKEVNRVLKDDGLVYLSVPNATWWRNILKDIAINKYTYAVKMHQWPQYSTDQRDHINNFNFIHLYRILNLNGFTLEHIDYTDLSNCFIFKMPYLKSLSSTLLLKVKKKKNI